MKLPLRFALLRFMAGVEKANLPMMMEALAPSYGDEKQFTWRNFKGHILSLEANGLAEETDVLVDRAGNLDTWYRITEDGKNLLRKYGPEK